MQGTPVRQRKQRDTRDTGIADKCKGRGEIRQIQTNSAETPRGRETRKREREREKKKRRQEDGKNRQERERQSEKAFTGEKQTGTVSKESRHEKTRKKIRKNRRRQYSEKPAGKAARQTEKISLRNTQRAQGMLQVVFAPASDGGGHRRT